MAFVFQGTRGLYETTEGRYAESAREMLETGNWLIPQLDYQPHFTKPPLTYWVIAGGMLIFGENEWGVRLGNSLAYIFLIFAMVSLGKMFWKEPYNYMASLMLSTSALVVVAAHMVSTDLLLTLFEFLTVLSYWKAVSKNKPAHTRMWIIVLWICAGLSFLTKGPPGLLSLLAIIIFHSFAKKKIINLPKLFSFTGIVAFLMVALPWFIYVIYTHKGLLSYFWSDEIIGRMVTNKFNRNPQWYKPFFVYGLPIIFGALPWLLFWPKIIFFIKKHLNKSGLKNALFNHRKILFLLIWFCVPLIILIVSSSRLPFYILPFFPPVIMLTTYLLTKIYDAGKLLYIIHAISIVTVLFFIVSKAVVASYPADVNMQKFYGQIEHQIQPGTSVVLVSYKKMYGLQFYLKGHLKRLDLGQGKMVVSDKINEIVDSLKHGGYGKNILFITSHKGEFIATLIKNNGYRYRQDKIDKKYISYFLEGS